MASPMDPSDYLTFPMLANPIPSRLSFPLQWNYVINSASVKYMSDRKIASAMDSIDPSNHLIFVMLAKPIPSRLSFPLQWNYVINLPSVKYMSDRKIACPMDPIDPSDYLTFDILANTVLQDYNSALYRITSFRYR